jgi:transcriptional regulator with XRE-family HTH domain
MESEDAKLLRAVGRRIGELRGARGWTQEQFSERYGVSTKYVQALEQGRQNLTLGSMARIARILGVPIGDLLHAPRSLQPNRGRPPQVRLESPVQTKRRLEGGPSPKPKKPKQLRHAAMRTDAKGGSSAATRRRR